MHTAAAVRLDGAAHATLTLNTSSAAAGGGTVAVDVRADLTACPGGHFQVFEAGTFQPTGVHLHGIRRLQLSAPAQGCTVIEVIVVPSGGAPPPPSRPLADWTSGGPWGTSSEPGSER